MEGDSNPVFTITSAGGITNETIEVDVKITETANFLQTANEIKSPQFTIGTPLDLPVELINDDVDEPSGTIYATLQLKDPQTYGIGAAHQASVGISDNDDAPTITFDETSFATAEGNLPAGGLEPTATVLTLDVALTHQSSQDIIINYTIGDNSNSTEATKDDDYSVPSTDTGTLTFPSYSTVAQTITINVAKDNLYEIDEEITVNFTIPSDLAALVEFPTEAGTGTIINSVTATITNDDEKPSVSIADAELLEGNSGTNMMSFTVTLSEPAGVPITVNYVTVDETATAGEDYTAITSTDNESVTIDPSNNSTSNTTGTINIDISGDSDFELDETFKVELTSATNAIIGDPDSAQGTILSDDAPAISIESISVNEDVRMAIMKVRLASPATTAINVPYNTTDGTASAGTDYTAKTGTLVFLGMDADGYQIGSDGNRISNGTGGSVLYSNADKVKTIQIAIDDDDRDEEDQTILVQLGPIPVETRARIFGDSTGIVTIKDNDDEPTIKIASVVTQTEPDDSSDSVTDTAYNIAVTLSHESEKDVSVDFAVTPGTAVATYDYLVNNSDPTLTFFNQATRKEIMLSIKADEIDENDETFTVQLTSATNAQLATNVTDPGFATNAGNQQTITINDNDDPPVISIDSVEVTEGKDTGGTFTITQTPNSGKSVEVTVTYVDVTATEGTNEDYQITTTGFDESTKVRTFVFDPADEPMLNATQTIAFTISDDDLDEEAETFTMTLSNPSSSTNFTLDTDNDTHIGTATITDNDGEPTLSINSEMVEEGTPIVFTPTLSTVSGRDVVITYSTEESGNFPAHADDYDEIPVADPLNNIPAATITIPAGQTTPSDSLSINTTQDTDPEPDETFTLNYSATNVSTETATGTATGTIKNDDNRIIAITSVSVIEGDDTAELEVIMSPAPDSEKIVVTYILSTDSAGVADYTHTIKPLEFAVGENKKTISVTITDDNLNEETETITAQLVHASIELFGGGAGKITINDNDPALPTLDLVELASNIIEETNATTNPTHNITVELSDAAGREIQVDYSIAEIEANIPLDVKLAESAPGRISDSAGVLTIAKGNSSATIPLEIIADHYDEDNETFKIVIANPVNAELGTKTTITPTIEDNDTEPKVSIAELVSVTETDADFTTTIAVTLDRASSKPVTVPFTVNAGSANANDYAFVDEPIVFTPVSETTITPISQVISITIMGDNVGEKTEQFTITLDTPTNGTINEERKVSTITITDDDAPVLSIGDGEVVTEADQAIAMFPITSSFNTNVITVYFTPTQTGDFLGSGLTMNELTSSVIDFKDGTGAILPILIENDEIVEANGSITVTLTDDKKMENGQPIITYSINESLDNSGTVNVIDDDTLPIVSIIPDSGSVAENAGTAKFMLTATGLTSNTTLDINATPAEDIGDFLTDSIADNANDFSVEFSDIDDDNTFTGEIEVILDNDNTGETTGKIKLTLNLDPDLADTYRLGETTEGIITVWDDDAPELKISRTSEQVDESATADFVISAEVSPNKSVAVRYDLAESGTVIDNSIEENRAGRGKVVELDYSGGKTEATFSINIDDDSIDEKNSTITVTLVEDNADPITYTIALSPDDSAKVEVIDDDGKPQIIMSTSTPTIKEGASAIFVLTATPEGSITPKQPVTVKLNAEQEGNFLMWRVPRTYKMDSTSETITLTTHDDNIVEAEGGSIKLYLVGSPNYVTSDNSAKNSATVTITDNDTPDGTQATEPETRISVAQIAVNNILNDILGAETSNNPAATESEVPSPINPNIPTVSINATNSQVDEGNPVEFTVTTSGSSENSAIVVRLNVNPVGDFFDFNESKQISKRIQGNESVPLIFSTIDDTIAEADGRLEVSIIPNASYKITSTQGNISVIVSDIVDRQVRQDLLTTSSQAFLPDVLGNMTVRTADLISQRVQQGFNETNNISLSLGGQESLRGLIEMSGEITNEGSISWREVLGDSSFAMTLLTGDDFAAPTTIWGVGDYRDLSSSSSSNSWSGDVFTGQFGIDALIGQEILTGLSASVTENDIEINSENAESLKFALDSTALTPYLSWTSPNQNAELQAIASYGIGEFSINQTDYGFETLTSRSYSFALSGRKELYASDSILNGVTNLNIIGDSWFASNYIEGQADLLADMQTDAHYLRLRTEGTHQFSFARGSSLTPLISVGIRDDRKDQLTNFGMELTSGFDYTDPIGLNLSGTGNMLYAGENTIQKMSLNGTLEYDYGNDNLGLTFGISPSWGQTQASVKNSIWSSNILTSDQEVGQNSDGTQVSSEIGYGFTLGEDSRKLNLYSGYEFDTVYDDQLSLGTRVSIGSNLNLDLEGTRAINTQESEVTKYQLNGRLTW